VNRAAEPAFVPAEGALDLPALSEAAAVMSIIAKAASDPNTDVVKLEKLMDMQERVLNRNARMAFASALSAMQSEMPVIDENGAIVHKEGEKPRSKYALFEDINDAVKPILQTHGFAITFRIKQLDAMIEITAVLSHREGHSEETSMRMPADSSGSKNTVQAMGSTVSYGKRYTMMALLNITSRAKGDRDDDGAATGMIDIDQAVIIDKLIADTKADKKAFLAYFKIDDVRKLKNSDHQVALDMLNKKAKKATAA
jgi:hypothetical protein